MSSDGVHPLAGDYLRRLQRAARRLPRADRRELYAEIKAHLAEATSLTSPNEEVLRVLDRLGDPNHIVEAQRPPRAARHTREWFAIVLLLLGGFAFWFGWFLGLVLLWSSSIWTTRDKLVGTLVLPFGLALAPFGLALTGSVQKCLSSLTRHSASSTTVTSHCTGGPTAGSIFFGLAVLAVLVTAPLVTARHLALRLR
jgi:hypothetical protein